MTVGPAPTARNVNLSPNITNKNNKQQFNVLISYLEKSGCQVHHADGDTYCVKILETCNKIIVCDNTDLMILLGHHATGTKNPNKWIGTLTFNEQEPPLETRRVKTCWLFTPYMVVTRYRDFGKAVRLN